MSDEAHKSSAKVDIGAKVTVASASLRGSFAAVSVSESSNAEYRSFDT